VADRLHADGWSVVAADRSSDGMVADDRRAVCAADVSTEAGNAAVVQTRSTGSAISTGSC
jgi:NAD(P)-dependent dehydrogenase (short-subunit alcohol dehydrogenase family)